MQQHLTLQDVADYLAYLSNTHVPDATTRTPMREWIEFGCRSLKCVMCDAVRQCFSGCSAPEYRVRDPAVDAKMSVARWNIVIALDHLLARGLHFRSECVHVRGGADWFDAAISWDAGRSYASVRRYLDRSPIAPFGRFTLFRNPSSGERAWAARALAAHFGLQESAMRVTDERRYDVNYARAARTWTNWIVRMVNDGVPPSVITLPEVQTLLESTHPSFRELGMVALAKVEISSVNPGADLMVPALSLSGTC